MNKTSINSDKLLLAFILFVFVVISTYLVLALIYQNQPLIFPWNEVTSSSW